MEDVLEVYAEPMILRGPRSILMRRPSNSFKRPDNRCQPEGDRSAMIMHMSGTARAISFSSWNPGRRRHVQVTEQRTKLDFAHARWLVTKATQGGHGDSRRAGPSQYP